MYSALLYRSCKQMQFHQREKEKKEHAPTNTILPILWSGMQGHRVDQEHIYGGMELRTAMLQCDHEYDAPYCRAPKPRKEPMLRSQPKRSLPFIIYSFLLITFPLCQSTSSSVTSWTICTVNNDSIFSIHFSAWRWSNQIFLHAHFFSFFDRKGIN